MKELKTETSTRLSVINIYDDESGWIYTGDSINIEIDWFIDIHEFTQPRL
jgi:hypothetical protein